MASNTAPLSLHAQLGMITKEIEEQRLEYRKAMALSQPGTLPNIMAVHNERIYSLLERMITLVAQIAAATVVSK